VNKPITLFHLSKRSVLPWAWAIVATAVALAAIAVWAPWRAASTLVPSEPVRFQIPVPETVNSTPTGAFALSRDGHQLAFGAIASGGVERIFVRSVDSLEARPVPGSEKPSGPPFFWSPDSRFSHTVSAGPPEMAIFLSSPAASNAMIFLQVRSVVRGTEMA